MVGTMRKGRLAKAIQARPSIRKGYEFHSSDAGCLPRHGADSAPGAIQRCAGYGKDSAKEGSPTMATTKLSDEALLAFFQSRRELRDRMASIVGAVGNSEGNLVEADAAEERLVGPQMIGQNLHDRERTGRNLRELLIIFVEHSDKFS